MLNSKQALHEIEFYTLGYTELHLTRCFNKEYVDKESTASYFENIFFCLLGKVFHLPHGLLR